MKKQQFLSESQKKIYLGNKASSKSPFNSFKKTPPKNVFTKTPSKQKSIPGIVFSAKPMLKSMRKIEPRLHHRSGKAQRMYTMDIDELYQRSEVDNIEESVLTPRSVKVMEDHYFEMSLSRVSEIRSKYSSNTIR
jgi:hypothetical protein